MIRHKLPADVLYLGARGDFGAAQVAFRQFAVGKEAQAVTYAAHVQAFHLLRFVALADDEFRGAAANIDHQPVRLRGGQAVRDADKNHARLFTTSDDFNGKPERFLSAFQQLRGIASDAKGVGGDCPYPVRIQAAQTLTKAPQTFDSTADHLVREDFVLAQTRAQPDHFAQGIVHEQLAIHQPRHLQTKAIGAEIDSGDLRWRRLTRSE